VKVGSQQTVETLPRIRPELMSQHTIPPMHRFLLLGSLLATFGCGASGASSLAGAKLVEVHVHAYPTVTDESGPPKDLFALESLPCSANELTLEIEVRAERSGKDKAEIFSSGGLAERIKANPANYAQYEIDDPLAYETSHTLDWAEIDVQGNGGVQVDRVSGSNKLVLRLDPKKGTFTGYEFTVVPKSAPDKTISKQWKPDFTCHSRTVIGGASGDLRHPRGNPGPNVTVYITKAKTAFGELGLALVEHGEKSQYVLIDPSVPHTFVSQGGSGVAGTSTAPGGDGGDGGMVQILLDKRYKDLESSVKWEAPGGKGGRGSRDGTEGAPGTGSVKVYDDTPQIFARRGDLPPGVSLIDPPKVKGKKK
jgi:hypothetical protein